MKKIIPYILFLCCSLDAFPQVLFLETFDNIPGATSGGPGTYSFPNGWFLRNVDNLTPRTPVSFINDAWERREDFNLNTTDSVAMSTSWYNPAGSADDWMWTPLIGPLGAGTVLTWEAIAPDSLHRDGYEVRVMLSSSGPPSGSTGVLGNQELGSTVLYSTTAENAYWTSRSASLGAYTGQSVYIGFRNNSADKYLLMIDDVNVAGIPDYDAALTSSGPLSEYTILPLCIHPSLNFPSIISNTGNRTITGVELVAELMDSAGIIVFSDTGSVIDSLDAGADTLWRTLHNFQPLVTGRYHALNSVTINETDGNTLNDSLSSATVTISDTVYARDNGTMNSFLGIGAGEPGYLGNQFEIGDTVRFSSGSVFLTNQPAGTKISMALFRFDQGKPSSVVCSFPADSLTQPFSGWLNYYVPDSTPVILYPDTYLLAAVETDSILKIGTCMNNFTEGKTWVNWPSSPFGDWANIESFPTLQLQVFMIRMNVHDICENFIVTVAADTSGPVCEGTPVTLTAAGAVDYLWNTGSINDSITIIPVVTSTYTVTGTDTMGCSLSVSLTVTVNPLPVVVAGTSSDTVCAGNPVTLTGSGAQTYTWSDGVTDGIPFVPLATQTYVVTGDDSFGCTGTDSVQVFVDPCLGIPSAGSGPVLISMYPNPGNGNYYFRCREAINIMVFDLTGKQMLNINYTPGDRTLDLSAMPAGIYLVSVKGNHRMQHLHLIKE